MLKIKMWANFQRIIELFTLKIVSDPGSGSATLGSRVLDICNSLTQVWVRFTVLGFEIDICNSLIRVWLRFTVLGFDACWLKWYQRSDNLFYFQLNAKGGNFESCRCEWYMQLFVPVHLMLMNHLQYLPLDPVLWIRIRMERHWFWLSLIRIQIRTVLGMGSGPGAWKLTKFPGRDMFVSGCCSRGWRWPWSSLFI